MSVLQLEEKCSAIDLCSDELDAQHAMSMAVDKLVGVNNVYAYVVMDYAVEFGKYENGQVFLGTNRSLLTMDHLKYVQELRLFHEQGEFKAVRSGDQFRCRYRWDEQSEHNEKMAPLTILDEIHKLWGSVKKNDSLQEGTRLQSNRGTDLYLPIPLGSAKENGIVVRSYIQINRQQPIGLDDTYSKASNLYRFIDERFVRFVDWREGESTF